MPADRTSSRRSRRPPRADIRAVADRAGVAISTVSRYLNGKKKLSADTERRIQEAVKTVGYAPNRVAQSLRLNRTMTLGMLIPDNSNPFFSGVIRGAEDVARAAGYALIIFNTNEDEAQELSHFSTIQALRCDGVLLIAAPPGQDEAARRQALERFPLPMVCLDRQPPLKSADMVMVDGLSGGYEAGRYLVKLGHRRLGIISPDYEIDTQRDRRAGFARALAEAHIPRQPELEARVPLTVDDGFSGASRLLGLPSPPTALFATSNSLSIGAVAAIRSRGLRCPDDVSVVGYDSYDWQEVFEPRLTTVKQPAYLMGQRGAKLLLERIAGRGGPPERVVLPTTLVVRDSCAAPRARGTAPNERETA